MASVSMPVKKDPLDQVAKGLQIAQSMFGIYSDYRGIKNMNAAEEAAAAAKDDQANKVISEPEKAALLSKNFELTDNPGDAQLAFNQREKDGTLKPVFFRKLLDSKETKIAIPKTENYEDKAGNKRQGIIDTATGRIKMSPDDPIVAYAPKEKPEKAPMPDLDKNRSQANTLRSEYNSQSAVNNQRLTAFKIVESTGTNPAPTASSDMSLVYSYMRLLDPGSMVKEGEYAMAENARGVPESIRNQYNKLIDGERLTPEQRKNMVAEGRNIAKTTYAMQREIDDRYSNLAKTYGIDENMVIDKKWQNLGQKFEEQDKQMASAAPKLGGPGLDPNIKKYADQHGLDYQRAAAILAGRGYKPNG